MDDHKKQDDLAQIDEVEVEPLSDEDLEDTAGGAAAVFGRGTNTCPTTSGCPSTSGCPAAL